MVSKDTRRVATLVLGSLLGVMLLGARVMIKPLTLDSHTIHFHAAKGDPQNPTWETESWHTITVQPEGQR